jgi:hypothetical protein
VPPVPPLAAGTTPVSEVASMLPIIALWTLVNGILFP